MSSTSFYVELKVRRKLQLKNLKNWKSEEFFSSAMSSDQTQLIIKPLRLQKSANWLIWLFFVRMIAESDKIWNLINSDQDTKSAHLSKSAESKFDDSENINFDAYAKWKAKMKVYKVRMIKYEKQHEIFKPLIKHIQSTILIDVVVLIANKSSHSYNLFQMLKLRFAPTDQIKKMQIKTKYHEVCRKSENQNLNKWLNAWRETYITNKTLNVYEMIKKRPIKDFIYSIMKKDETWANAHLIIIDEEIKKDSLFNLITKFKNHTRMKLSKKLHQNSYSTFAVSVLFRNMKQQPQKCLCGEMHWWIDCTYLNSAERSYNWQIDSETAKRVNEIIKNSDTKKRVENAIKHAMKKKNQFNQIHQLETSSAFVVNESYYEIFITVIVSSSSLIATDYSLLSFWILDNGSKTHIYNKSM